MASGKNSYTMQGGLDMLGSNFVEGNEGGGLGAGEQGLVWRVSDLGGSCWCMLKRTPCIPDLWVTWVPILSLCK